MEKNDNRRRYFRIDDVVELSYEIINLNDVVESSHDAGNIFSIGSLSIALEALSKETAKHLHQLERERPDTAHYLKLLEDKINLIAQVVVLQGKQSALNKTNPKVNLSASGLAFQNSEFIAEGSFLKLKMLLIASRVLITTCGTVINCTKMKSGDDPFPYRVSVDFVSMREQELDLVIKHLMKLQTALIREKRLL